MHGSTTRICELSLGGRKDSLVIYPDCHWHSFEADEWGQGPQSFIEFLRPGIEPAEVRRFVLDWLRTHPAPGVCGSYESSQLHRFGQRLLDWRSLWFR